MKQYPHGLDEDMVSKNLETEQRLIAKLEPHTASGYAEKKSALFKGLGKCFYAVGGLRYVLDEPEAQVKDSYTKALEHLYTAFDFGIPQQAYEFIRLLSLAFVMGNSEIAQTLANTKRERYTNENVEVEEITFTVAALMSAFIRRDKSGAGKIIAENDSNGIDENKIFRYDRMIYLPLFSLLKAVYQKDAARFSAAMKIRESEFIKYFKRAPIKNDPDALIDMPGLAITAIAAKHGINANDLSVYHPYNLIAGR